MIETIDDALGAPPDVQRIASEVSQAVKEHRQKREAYAGGLEAERQSWREIQSQGLARIRAAHLRGVGRPIDLIALLRQRNSHGMPIWAYADPARRLSSRNGGVMGSGNVAIAPATRENAEKEKDHVIVTGRSFSETPGRTFIPQGIPAIPARAREILQNGWIRQRAACIGILFQPQAWAEVDPDPAIVVEWRDLPGEHFCLAVWGDDRPAIEEFIKD